MNFSSKLNSGIITIVAGIFLLSANAMAQPDQRQRRPPMLPDSTQIVKRVNELSSALSLSKNQKEKLTKLHYTHFKQAGELLKKDKSDRENNRNKMETLRKEFEEQVKSLLNDDQKKKFENFLTTHGPGHEHKGEMNHPRREEVK